MQEPGLFLEASLDRDTCYSEWWNPRLCTSMHSNLWFDPRSDHPGRLAVAKEAFADTQHQLASNISLRVHTSGYDLDLGIMDPKFQKVDRPTQHGKPQTRPICN